MAREPHGGKCWVREVRSPVSGLSGVLVTEVWTGHHLGLVLCVCVGRNIVKCGEDHQIQAVPQDMDERNSQEALAGLSY